METFVQSQVEGGGEHGEENLDSEFIFGEFLEALARCAEVPLPHRTPSLAPLLWGCRLPLLVCPS